VWVAAGGACTVGLVAALVVAARETGDPPAASTTATTAGCDDRPYQPSGQSQPAPGTDGDACLPGFEDYDEAAANGCEAADDGLQDDAPFDDDAIEGTIVPRDDVDTFAMRVGDGRQLLCDGRFTVTLTAPAGVALRLEVLDGDEVLGLATSADGVPGVVRLDEPECLFDDSGTLTARVAPVGSDRTAEPYLLERRGSF
jgi:hypothetical protein